MEFDLRCLTELLKLPAVRRVLNFTLFSLNKESKS